jgi:hypothetical protein
VKWIRDLLFLKIWRPSKFLIDFSPIWKLKAAGRQKYVQKEAGARLNYVQRAPYSSQSRPPILCRKAGHLYYAAARGQRLPAAKKSLNRCCAGHLVSAAAGSRRPPKVRPKGGPPKVRPKGGRSPPGMARQKTRPGAWINLAQPRIRPGKAKNEAIGASERTRP